MDLILPSLNCGFLLVCTETDCKVLNAYTFHQFQSNSCSNTGVANLFWRPSISADDHLLHTVTRTLSLNPGNDNGIEHSKTQHKLHCGLETFAKYFHIYYLN